MAMYLSLERQIQKPDCATVRARHFALLMAKRTAAPLTGTGHDELPHFAPELWLQIARAVPLSGVEWIECPFLEWVTTPAPELRTASAEFSRRLDVTMRERMAECYADIMGILEECQQSDPEAEEMMWDEAVRYAWTDAAEGNSDVFRELSSGALGYHTQLFTNQQIRDSSGLANEIFVKALRCVRLGRPNDTAVKLLHVVNEEPDHCAFCILDDSTGHVCYNDELVYGFCTLDELFAVDWHGLADENESDHRDIEDTLELLCGWLIKFSMTPGVSLTEFRMLFRVHGTTDPRL